MIVTTNVFPEFKTTKYVVRQISKKAHFRTPFDSQHIKGSQISVKSAWHHFYLNSPSLWSKVIWKMSLLVIWEILGATVNTLTVDDKYPFRNCDNLPLSIQMQLSNEKTFSQFFVPFLAFASSHTAFEKKMIVIANLFPKLQTLKGLVRPLSKKRRFRTMFWQWTC